MTAGAVEGELVALDAYPGLEADWRTLELAADGSPFNTWSWVSVWLRHLPPAFKPRVFRARDRDGVLALALLVEARERGWRRLFGHHSIHLQETGNRELDEVTIEYAGLLVRRGAETRGYAALFDVLGALDRRWRSLRIGASTHAQPVLEALPSTLQAYSTITQAAHRVNLAALRRSGVDYIGSLGSRTRRGMRQTRRSYEALGDLRVQTASEPAEALAWLEELRLLHARHWNGKGQPGSFASAFFVDFHRDLVRAGTATGYTQLMKITAGPSVVGYLYNIVWRGCVYFYNSGLNYGLLSRNDRPGYLAQWLAIDRHLADGQELYDFMAGDQTYKWTLGSDPQALHWIDIRQDGWRLASERALLRRVGRSIGTPLATAVAMPLPQRHD
jgi:CelD/BcsL family acetyltransferase involved in cellulose biosynthesis